MRFESENAKHRAGISMPKEGYKCPHCGKSIELKVAFIVCSHCNKVVDGDSL